MITIAIFHASSVGLRYSLVFICFSFFISIELVKKRNRYICGSICLMFQMIDIGSLLMPIFRPGLSLLFIRFLPPISGDFVSRSIRVLKTNKVVGFDKIGAPLLKDSVDVITPSLTNLQIIVNFNKMLETLIFQRSYAQYLNYFKYTSHKQVIKSGGSSSEHYF